MWSLEEKLFLTFLKKNKSDSPTGPLSWTVWLREPLCSLMSPSPVSLLKYRHAGKQSRSLGLCAVNHSQRKQFPIQKKWNSRTEHVRKWYFSHSEGLNGKIIVWDKVYGSTCLLQPQSTSFPHIPVLQTQTQTHRCIKVWKTCQKKDIPFQNFLNHSIAASWEAQ